MYNRIKRKLVFGVGINDADYVTQTKRKDGYSLICPIYKSWMGVMDRAFNPQRKQQNTCYANTTVCEEWVKFSGFREWMLDQTFLDLTGAKLNLDKDILLKGNQVYCPDACAFIPARINTLIVLNDRSRGEQPIGVFLHKERNERPFRASVNGNKDDRIRSTYYDTAEEAHAWWQEMKAKVIREAVDLWKIDPVHNNSFRQDVADALIARADFLDRHRAEGIETKYL